MSKKRNRRAGRTGLNRNGKISFLLAFLIIFIVGCQSAEPTYKVIGQVRYREKALPTGVVVFYPENGRPLDPATIDANGTFHLEAPAGKYRVAVIAMPSLDDNGNAASQRPEEVGTSPRPLIPERYSQPKTSGLVVTIETKDPNEVDLTLR